MVTEKAAEVASSAIDAMKNTPLALALLLVNLCFLGFAGYILSQINTSSQERNKVQMALISEMVKITADACRGR